MADYDDPSAKRSPIDNMDLQYLRGLSQNDQDSRSTEQIGQYARQGWAPNQYDPKKRDEPIWDKTGYPGPPQLDIGRYGGDSSDLIHNGPNPGFPSGTPGAAVHVPYRYMPTEGQRMKDAAAEPLLNTFKHLVSVLTNK